MEAYPKEQEVTTAKQLTTILLLEARDVYSRWYSPVANTAFQRDIRAKIELIDLALNKVEEWDL